MAKNVTVAGASYPAVPSVQLPQTEGGVATFYDCVGSKRITENGSVEVVGLASVEVDVETDAVQADWSQTDETAADYIKNKPEIPHIDHVNTDDNPLTPAGFHALGDGMYYIVNPIEHMSGDISAQGLTSVAGGYVNNLDYGHCFSDFNGTNYSTYGSIDGFGLKEATPIIEELNGEIEALEARIDEVELFKFPNVTIIGEPTLNHGQVTDFSAQNYMQFPFLVDFQNRGFEINMAFITGSDVTTQQNIFDSNFGLAFAVSQGHFLMAVSTNGTSWNVGAKYGTYSVQPNTPYYVRISWNGMLYKVEYSLDKRNYTQDFTMTATQSPYPRHIVIGVGDLGKATVHAFGGIINLNDSNVKISGELIWQGMDDAGLVTRLATDMSNIDDAGKERVNELVADQIQDAVGSIETALQAVITQYEEDLE